MKIKVKIRGTRELIPHNSRLANPLDPKTRALKELTNNKKKTEELQARIAMTEALASYYETPDGLVGMPTQNVHRSFKDAATTLKLGKQLTKALRFGGNDTSPILIGGQSMKPEEHLRDKDNLFMVSVRNQNNRVMRSRPMLHDWESEHIFELDEKLLNLSELKQIAEIAGRDVGLCDWRPRYGTFEAVIEKAA